MQEYGEKEIALVPNDVSTLALLGQTLPRALHGSASDPAAVQVLAKRSSTPNKPSKLRRRFRSPKI